MFKNIVKKFLAVGLAFALCVPCCFASAQTEKYLEELIREEVARVLAENKLRCRVKGAVVAPSQMNMKQLLWAYNWLVDRGIARALEDLAYFTQPQQYHVTLLNQAYTGPVIRREVKRCVQKLGMRPHYQGHFLNLDQMNNEQLMWFYNWLFDQGKAMDVENLMA